MFIIDDSTPRDKIFVPGCGTGYETRDYKEHPLEMFAAPSEMDVIPQSEWDARIEERTANKSGLKDIRMRANNGGEAMCLDQNGDPFCWGHSTAQGIILKRAQQGQPYLELSAYMLSCLPFNGAKRGGWCGLSAKVAREVGICTQFYWPQGSRSMSHDTPAMRANAALHKITEDFVDLAQPVYDQDLTFAQTVSSLLRNEPVPLDYDWMGHSMCAIDVVRVEAGSYGILCLNSWYIQKGVQWGDHGTGVFRGQRAIPNQALSIRSVLPAAD